MQKCDIVPSVKSDHTTATLLAQHNSSSRGRGYWKFNNYMLLDDEYISKTNAIVDYLLNNTRWEALKCFLRGHIINYFRGKKKKMLSTKQNALENLSNTKRQIHLRQITRCCALGKDI